MLFCGSLIFLLLKIKFDVYICKFAQLSFVFAK